MGPLFIQSFYWNVGLIGREVGRIYIGLERQLDERKAMMAKNTPFLG